MLFPIKVTQPSYSRPVVTVSLIVANVLVFLHQISLDPYSLHQYIADYGLRPNPHYFHFANIFTAMFVHAGWVHIGGNMLFLWVFGDNVEDILGHGKFLLFYLLCGVAAALAQIAASPLSTVPMVGASGAIAGVMGAYLVRFPRSHVEMLFFAIFFFRFEVAAWFMLAYWFVIQIAGGFGGTEASQSGTAFFAHVGGFVAGIVLVNIMGTRERGSRRDLSW
jgi:membrane associated rhomboid family serine protease